MSEPEKICEECGLTIKVCNRIAMLKMDIKRIQLIEARLLELDTRIRQLSRESIVERFCSNCGGSGKDTGESCARCKGSGTELTELGAQILSLVRRHLIQP